MRGRKPVMRSRQHSSPHGESVGDSDVVAAAGTVAKKTTRSMSSTSARLGSLSAWGAKMRSYTVGGAVGGAKQDLDDSVGNANGQASTTTTVFRGKEAGKDTSAHMRRRSNLFGSLISNTSKSDLRADGAATATGTAPSSSGSSSLEHRRGTSSFSTHDEYSIVHGVDFVDEPLHKWYDDSEAIYDHAKFYEDDANLNNNDRVAEHISSANAYLTEDAPVHAATTSAPSSPPQLPGKRRRLSIPSLSQWSSSSILSSPSRTGRNDDDEEAIIAAMQASAIEGSTPTGTFSLHSFRNIRSGTTASSAAHDDNLAPTLDCDASHSQSRQPSGVQPGRRSSVQSCAPPNSPPLSKSSSPLSSMPGSPRSERLPRPRAGSMTVGSFLRAAAAAQSRLELSSTNCVSGLVDDDNNHSSEKGRGADVDQPFRTSCGDNDSRRGSVLLGSPYVALTPLGSGARNPGEELAIIEADLERARNHSLMYLAQLEEQQIRREEQRRRQRPIADSDDCSDHYGTDIGGVQSFSYFPSYEIGEGSRPRRD